MRLIGIAVVLALGLTLAPLATEGQQASPLTLSSRNDHHVGGASGPLGGSSLDRSISRVSWR
jgi:hypothetical protein